MPRRREASCGPRSFGFAFPGSSGGLPGWRLVGALGHRYGGGLFSSLERDARLSEETPISRRTAALNGEGLSVSPSGDRAARSRSSAGTPLHFLSRVPARTRRR